MTNLENDPLTVPVLLLIHGATLNGRMWDPVKRFLDPRFPTLAPDLPGHGTKRGQHYTVQGAVETVVAAVKSVFPAPVILVGDSLGAYSALASASALPSGQLLGLVLGGSTFDFKGFEAYPAVTRGALMSGLARLFGEERIIKKLMPRALSSFGIADDDAREIIAAGMSIRAFRQAVKAIRNEDFIAEVSRIEQPVLYVNGDKDTPCVAQEAKFIAASRHASNHRFDCGHGVSLWRPREFADLVSAFALAHSR
jgi:pimeloyl-ACP methyl ester carboxylesterase